MVLRQIWEVEQKLIGAEVEMRNLAGHSLGTRFAE